jgi:hypothetical protein
MGPMRRPLAALHPTHKVADDFEAHKIADDFETPNYKKYKTRGDSTFSFTGERQSLPV